MCHHWSLMLPTWDSISGTMCRIGTDDDTCLCISEWYTFMCMAVQYEFVKFICAWVVIILEASELSKVNITIAATAITISLLPL